MLYFSDNNHTFMEEYFDGVAGIPEIDLHGMYPDDAEQLLHSELYRFGENNQKVVRVIYGAGTGVLAKTIIESLAQNPMVSKSFVLTKYPCPLNNKNPSSVKTYVNRR